MKTAEYIDRRNPVPLHEQCKTILLEQIRAGAFQRGDRIPPERKLEEMYGLSRTTIRQAVSELVQRGVLQRIQGKGTFVTGSAVPFDLHQLTSFTEDMRARGLTPSATLVFAGLVDADDRKLDLLRTENPVFEVHRLRYGDDRIMGFHRAFLPKRFAVPSAEIERTGSLYDLLARRFHVEPFASDEMLEGGVATPHEAEALDIPVGAAVLRVERLTFDHSDTPLELVEMCYRADEYKYFVRLKRH
jgi:GntR family transcriptional regulator